MKRIVFALGVMLLVLSVSVSAQTQTASVEQELTKLENEWAKSIVKLDLAFMERILADDYTWTDQAGNVHSKAEEIASIKRGQGVVTFCVLDWVKVRVYGDAAVLIGRTTQKEIAEGKEVSGQYQWTDVWVKRNGRWQCVADHVSDVPQK